MATYICIEQQEIQERFFFIEIGLVRLEKDGRGHPFFLYQIVTPDSPFGLLDHMIFLWGDVIIQFPSTDSQQRQSSEIKDTVLQPDGLLLFPYSWKK